VASQFFATKSIDRLISDSQEEGHRLKKVLGPWSLTALGIGAIIGSGIFVLTGTAAAGVTLQRESILHAVVLDLILHGKDALTSGRMGAGPGISISFLMTAFACGLSALCYAELASMIPVAGSAYTYSYATLGELVAWIIGWDLILEYAVGNVAVAVGFSGYFASIMDGFGLALPEKWSKAAWENSQFTGNYFNVPAFLVVMIITVLLVRGVKESTRANNVIVLIKVGALVVFLITRLGYINTANWKPFVPHGFPSLMTGAAIVFFTYIGFDAVSTAAEECHNPQKDLPFGIFASLIICTFFYVSVALVLTGMEHYSKLGNEAAVANAMKSINANIWVQRIIVSGALIGMVSTLLCWQLGQARIWFAMARDRLLPTYFGAVHSRFQTPHISTWIAGVAVALPSGIWGIADAADLCNIGTLFAFILVSAGVLILRKTQPDRPRSFRVPFSPVAPWLSIFCCLVLMTSLTLITWLRFFVWLAIGLCIYFAYSRHRTEFAQN